MTVERKVKVNSWGIEREATGSFQYFVRDTRWLFEDEAKRVDAKKFIAVELFDYLVQAGDRSPRRRNFILRQNDQLVAIDHEGIFSGPLESRDKHVESNFA